MPNDTVDKTIICVTCHRDFPFTPGEQAYYAEKGFNAPRHCKVCRHLRKERQREAGNSVWDEVPAAPAATPAPPQRRRGGR